MARTRRLRDVRRRSTATGLTLTTTHSVPDDVVRLLLVRAHGTDYGRALVNGNARRTMRGAHRIEPVAVRLSTSGCVKAPLVPGRDQGESVLGRSYRSTGYRVKARRKGGSARPALQGTAIPRVGRGASIARSRRKVVNRPRGKNRLCESCARVAVQRGATEREGTGVVRRARRFAISDY